MEVLLTEDDKTEIYIKGDRFIQCSHVLTTVHTDEIESVLLLESVDDIKQAPSTIVIDPETRYFVHCSNLQAWVENNFDSRMLHSNLSFPLLKKRIKEGYVNIMILQEQIAKFFECRSYENIFFYFYRGYLDLLPKEYFLDYFSKERSPKIVNFVVDFMIKYFEGMRCENEHLDLISFSKDELRYHGYIDIYSDDMPYIPYQNFTDFLLEYLSKEDLADIIAANLPKNINPLLLCAFYNFNLIDRDFLTQYLAKILDSGDRKMKNDAERVAERYYSSEEMMSLIPQRFHAIKEIVKKIQIDFSLWAVDSFGTYDGDNDITNSTKLLFSIVSNDAIWIGIQHYPDLARYFTWIIETLGKLNSNVKIELELASTNVFSLPENTPIIPQEFTLRIYDYSTDKIYKKNMNSSFEEVSK